MIVGVQELFEVVVDVTVEEHVRGPVAVEGVHCTPVALVSTGSPIQPQPAASTKALTKTLAIFV